MDHPAGRHRTARSSLTLPYPLQGLGIWRRINPNGKQLRWLKGKAISDDALFYGTVLSMNGF